MEIAKYPEKICREAVAGTEQSYYCELPLTHPGPCASFSVKDSVRLRDVYEENNPDWRSQLGGEDVIVHITL